MKNKNVIIALIFLVIVALFAFSFEKMTGFAPKSVISPTVTITPHIIKAGEEIKIKIKINKACIDPNLEFYFAGIDPNGNRVSGADLRKGSKLYKPSVRDCTKSSRRGSYIPCSGSKYCKNDLINDIITTTYKTSSDWSGTYYLKTSYWKDTNTKDYVKTEFKIR